MGYCTEFKGELKFKNELTASQISFLDKILGEDVRELSDDLQKHKDHKYWYHINLYITDDYDAIKWDESENTYSMDSVVNFVTACMKEHWPDFELTGELIAQGEEFDDRWKLVMIDGVAKRVEYPKNGDKITCPKCNQCFILEK